MKNNRVIFLLDMDAFYASCHIADDPSLKDKILVVSSPNRRSIITTASYKARAFGIKAGMPLFKAQELCKDVYPVHSNFPLYIKFSQKVFEVISKNFSEKIEVASIDECYIDVTHVWKKFGSVKKLADKIREKVFEETRLTCSIGISTIKFLAKSCVDFNKPNGVSFLLPDEIEEKLWPLEIKEMYMVGEATEKILLENNIKTIGDLAHSDLQLVIDLLGKRGYTLWHWANGIGDDDVQEESNELKSIGNEFTLNYTTSNVAEIEEMLYELSLKISARAKMRFLKGKTVSVILKYENDKSEAFNLKERKKHATKQEALSSPTNDCEVIYSIAKECFFELWNGTPILLLGVRLTKLIDEINIKKQLSFDDIDLNDRLNLNDVENIIYDMQLKFGEKNIFTGDKLIKYNDKNKGQSKYLKNDSVHISNQEIIDKWKK
ncbi:Y-family DNA polymerase [Spiroplasma chinense]|nr:DNA polymerase IV [Spiroplasma chinense]